MVPDQEDLQQLERDFEAMIAAGLFHPPEPTFEWLVERIRDLEVALRDA